MLLTDAPNLAYVIGLPAVLMALVGALGVATWVMLGRIGGRSGPHRS